MLAHGERPSRLWALVFAQLLDDYTSVRCHVGVQAAAAVGSGHRARLQSWARFSPPVWTGSWTESADNPSAAGVISAMTGAIGAARACAARDHASRNASLTGGWYLPRLVRSSWGEATADDH